MRRLIKELLFIMIFVMLFITISYGNSIDFGMNVERLTGNQTALESTKLKDTGDYIFSIVTSIGVVVSVIIIAVLGIKYILGSVEERAEYKKTLMPYLIGATLVFGASTIATIIYKFVK